MLKEALNTTLLPVMDELVETLFDMAKSNDRVAVLSRTHGQPASPTTLGEEIPIFAYRLSRERKEISQLEIMGKFAGAVGNYNAHLVAYPNIWWPQIAEEFVNSLGLSFNPHVTQIEPHDYMAKLFHAFISFNVLIDFDRDVWGCISNDYFKLITNASEIGSSAMPHKVNPIDFENSEGNLGMANVVFIFVRWQVTNFSMTGRPLMCVALMLYARRGLTDSTVLRNMCVGLGYSLLAYKNALQGVAKLQVHEAALFEDLKSSWEVMRKYGIPEPYEKLRELTRGKAVTRESVREFIHGLDLLTEAKSDLLNLTPQLHRSSS